MANLATLRLRVYRKLGLDQTASGDEETAVTSWLNEGVLNVLLDTHCYIDTTTLDLVAGTYDYDLQATLATAGTGMLEINKLIDSAGIPFLRVSPEEIYDKRRASGATASSGTRRYAMDANLLMIWPTPSTAETITLYGVPYPAALSATADDPSSVTKGGVPEWLHKAIEYYALAEGADYDDDFSSQMGDRYRNLYGQEIAKFRMRQAKRGGRKLSRSRFTRRKHASHDPSEDNNAW